MVDSELGKMVSPRELSPEVWRAAAAEAYKRAANCILDAKDYETALKLQKYGKQCERNAILAEELPPQYGKGA